MKEEVKVTYWVKKEVMVKRKDLIKANATIRTNMEIPDDQELSSYELIEGLRDMGAIENEEFDTEDETTFSTEELDTLESFGG